MVEGINMSEENKKETETTGNSESIVRRKYPNAIVVKTFAQGLSHYRIWPTSGFFETRCIGRGDTPELAWQDAMSKLKA